MYTPWSWEVPQNLLTFLLLFLLILFNKSIFLFCFLIVLVFWYFSVAVDSGCLRDVWSRGSILTESGDSTSSYLRWSTPPFFYSVFLKSIENFCCSLSILYLKLFPLPWNLSSRILHCTLEDYGELLPQQLLKRGQNLHLTWQKPRDFISIFLPKSSRQ